MRRWIPWGLTVLGLLILAFLSWPVFEPSFVWALVLSPTLLVAWNTATAAGGITLASGLTWLLVRYLRSRSGKADRLAERA